MEFLLEKLFENHWLRSILYSSRKMNKGKTKIFIYFTINESQYNIIDESV